MSVIISNSNQELLWAIINKSSVLQRRFPTNSPEKTKWFQSVIERFYYNYRNVDIQLSHLQHINKDIIQFMVQSLEQIPRDYSTPQYDYQPPQPPHQQQPLYQPPPQQRSQSPPQLPPQQNHLYQPQSYPQSSHPSSMSQQQYQQQQQPQIMSSSQPQYNTPQQPLQQQHPPSSVSISQNTYTPYYTQPPPVPLQFPHMGNGSQQQPSISSTSMMVESKEEEFKRKLEERQKLYTQYPEVSQNVVPPSILTAEKPAYSIPPQTMDELLKKEMENRQYLAPPPQHQTPATTTTTTQSLLTNKDIIDIDNNNQHQQQQSQTSITPTTPTTSTVSWANTNVYIEPEPSLLEQIYKKMLDLEKKIETLTATANGPQHPQIVVATPVGSMSSSSAQPTPTQTQPPIATANNIENNMATATTTATAITMT